MRFENNFKILEIIKQGLDLKQYSGFGGLYKTMNQADHTKLKNLLGENSYNQVMASSKTAYYTPKEIIDFMYLALGRLGFKGGRILEPACGHGAFIFNMPDTMKINSSIHAVELDKLSTQLAKNICPYANITNCSFERYQDNNFDLIIGNPPYSNTVIRDADKELDNYVIHHYFMAKSIKLLKEGGILAFVVPSYCLDNIKGHARNMLNRHARLISSFRLPDNMFDNAKVTVDIVFFQKTTNKNIGYDFLNTKPYKAKGKDYPLNEYYHNNKGNILGDIDTAFVYGERVALTVSSSLNKEQTYLRLNAKLDRLKPIYEAKKDISLINHIQLVKERISNDTNSNNLKDRLQKLELEKLEIIEQEYMNIYTQAQDCLKSFQTEVI